MHRPKSERKVMNDKFDELAKGLTQSVMCRGALKRFGVAFAGIMLATVCNSSLGQGTGALSAEQAVGQLLFEDATFGGNGRTCIRRSLHRHDRPAMYLDPIARSGWDLPAVCTDRQAGVINVSYQVLAGPATNRPSIMFTRCKTKAKS